MADFVAVLRKTIDGLGETTPEMRARVYDKARSTIAAKLAQMNPPPPAAVVERQKASLEQAISALEAEFAPALPAELDEFESIMAGLGESSPEPQTRPAKAPPAAANQAVAAAAPSATDTPGSDASAVRRDVRKPARARSGNRGGLIVVTLIGLAFLGAASYAIWLNRDEVAQLVGMTGDVPGAERAEEQPAPDAVAAAPEPAPAEPVEAEPPPAAPAAAPKFTQRLNEDGSETDTGPADPSTDVGEGTSVAALTVPPEQAPPAQQPAAATPAAEAPATPDTQADVTPPAVSEEAAPAAETPAPVAPSAATPDPAVAVGQRAIFYEERTSAAQGSAEQGTTVWSLVQESPGGDLPPEPAIRADATVPGKDIQLRLTIRRNGDKTLPASHIVELIFLTPEGFEGGAIDNFLRMTMKETEEATGNPVLGLPAKIGDGFFLLALTDSTAEVEANMQLFRRMKWIDLPIVYRSGRRALMTLERGIPGDRVFEDALRAWAASG